MEVSPSCFFTGFILYNKQQNPSDFLTNSYSNFFKTESKFLGFSLVYYLFSWQFILSRNM